MITVLYFSDANVRAQLFDAASRGDKPVLVAGIRHGKGMKPPQTREPFASLEARFGRFVDQVVVADEGSVEGMWRDPLGDLADALFANDRSAAYAAAAGYLLINRGKPLAIVKKQGAAADDAWFIQEMLSKHLHSIPPPDAKLRPGKQKAQKEQPRAGSRRIEDEDTDPRARPLPPQGPLKDPWAVLGVPPGTAKDEAKKAFRALITQYHPDKVSHLGPEFRELADKRTREILEAWALVEKS